MYWSIVWCALLWSGLLSCKGSTTSAPKLLAFRGDTVEVFQNSRDMLFVACPCGDSLQVYLEEAPKWVRLERLCDTLYRLIINAPQENDVYYAIPFRVVNRGGQLIDRDSVVVHVRRPFARLYIIDNPSYWRALLKYLDVGDLVVIRGDSFPRLRIEGLHKLAVYIRPESGYKGRLRGFDIHQSSGIDIGGFEFVYDTIPAVSIDERSRSIRLHHNLFRPRHVETKSRPALYVRGKKVRVDFNAYVPPFSGAAVDRTVRIKDNYRLCEQRR